jgi:outer membrane protein assembly factor BamB
MRWLACIAGTFTVSLLLSLSLAADWPGFRGPGGRGVSPETDLPLRWGPKQNVHWTAPVPGRGQSGPVVASGRVYVTACSGYKQRRLHVFALDEATGKRLWERQFSATGSTACHPASSMAAATPAADDRAVYALFATGDLAALDRDGNLLWYRSLVGDYPDVTNQVGLAASPVLSGGVLLLPMDNAGESFAAGLDRRTGKNLWKVKRRRCVTWASPVAYQSGGRALALFQSDTEATAYDATTGKQAWTFEGKGLDPIKSPCVGEGMAFLAAGKLLALRPGKAGPTEAWRAGNLAQGYASPVYHNGRVYYLTPVAVVCLDAASGKELWRRRLAGPFDASPVIAGEVLYAVNNQGRTHVISLGKEPKVLAHNDLGAAVQATPALSDGRLFFRTENAVVCVGRGK